MDFSRIKSMLFTGIAVFFIFSLFRTCLCSSGGSEEEVQIPTEGLITTVAEVERNSFKIEDETTIPDTAASLIIAKYMSGKIDTFTLAEARLVQQGHSTGHSSMAGPIMAAAGAGFLGYMMGRSMRTPPSPSAYTNQQAYNRVNSTTGSSLNRSAARVSRPSAGRSSSGFGGGRSSRGFGG
jgi:hypothetical protein